MKLVKYGLIVFIPMSLLGAEAEFPKRGSLLNFTIAVMNTLNDSDYDHVSKRVAPVTGRLSLENRQRHFEQLITTGALANKDIYCFQEWDGTLIKDWFTPFARRYQHVTDPSGIQLLTAWNNDSFIAEQRFEGGSVAYYKPFGRIHEGFTTSGHFGYMLVILQSKQDPSVRIGVINTHLQGRPSDPVEASQKMVHELIVLIGLYPDISNWIVCGDFNVHGLDRTSSVPKSYRSVFSQLFANEFVQVVPPYVSSFVKDAAGPRPNQTDYIFLKNIFVTGLSLYPRHFDQLLKYAHDSSDTEKLYASDHAALIAQLAIQR